MKALQDRRSLVNDQERNNYVGAYAGIMVHSCTDRHAGRVVHSCELPEYTCAHSTCSQRLERSVSLALPSIGDCRLRLAR